MSRSDLSTNASANTSANASANGAATELGGRRRSRTRAVPVALSAILIALGIWCAAYFGLLPTQHPALRWCMPWSAIARSRAAEHAEQRAQRVADFMREAVEWEAAPPRSERERPVVFLGSSTIERMPLAALFPGRPTLNRGLSDEPIAGLAQVLPAALPAVPLGGVVVFAGRVELLETDRSVESIAAELHELLRGVVARSAGAPLCLLGLPPSRSPSQRERRDLSPLNARLADLAREFDAAFVPLARPPLVDPNGVLSESCSADALHLRDEGYAQLAQWLLHEGGAVGRNLAP